MDQMQNRQSAAERMAEISAATYCPGQYCNSAVAAAEADVESRAAELRLAQLAASPVTAAVQAISSYGGAQLPPALGSSSHSFRFDKSLAETVFSETSVFPSRSMPVVEPLTLTQRIVEAHSNSQTQTTTTLKSPAPSIPPPAVAAAMAKPPSPPPSAANTSADRSVQEDVAMLAKILDTCQKYCTFCMSLPVIETLVSDTNPIYFRELSAV
jgi:hypothetical protein